jgi:hypothetical protein
MQFFIAFPWIERSVSAVRLVCVGWCRRLGDSFAFHLHVDEPIRKPDDTPEGVPRRVFHVHGEANPGGPLPCFGDQPLYRGASDTLAPMFAAHKEVPEEDPLGFPLKQGVPDIGAADLEEDGFAFSAKAPLNLRRAFGQGRVGFAALVLNRLPMHSSK